MRPRLPALPVRPADRGRQAARHASVRVAGAQRAQAGEGFGTWARDFRPLYGPLEAGLDRFVAYRKEADFIGKAAALRERELGGSLRRLVFAVDATTADVLGDEPVWHQGEVCGWVTSGGYAHASGVSVAIAYVPKERADAEEGWEIEVLGERLGASILRTALFDHNGERMRN